MLMYNFGFIVEKRERGETAMALQDRGYFIYSRVTAKPHDGNRIMGCVPKGAMNVCL